jgi:hypothetical protein
MSAAGRDGSILATSENYTTPFVGPGDEFDSWFHLNLLYR